MRGFPDPTAVRVSDHIVSLGVHTGAEVRYSSLSLCTGFKLISSFQAVLGAISSLCEDGGDWMPSPVVNMNCDAIFQV